MGVVQAKVKGYKVLFQKVFLAQFWTLNSTPPEASIQGSWDVLGNARIAAIRVLESPSRGAEISMEFERCG